jgi:hypothetical protein
VSSRGPCGRCYWEGKDPSEAGPSTRPVGHWGRGLKVGVASKGRGLKGDRGPHFLPLSLVPFSGQEMSNFTGSHTAYHCPSDTSIRGLKASTFQIMTRMFLFASGSSQVSAVVKKDCQHCLRACFISQKTGANHTCQVEML